MSRHKGSNRPRGQNVKPRTATQCRAPARKEPTALVNVYEPSRIEERCVLVGGALKRQVIGSVYGDLLDRVVNPRIYELFSDFPSDLGCLHSESPDNPASSYTDSPADSNLLETAIRCVAAVKRKKGGGFFPVHLFVTTYDCNRVGMDYETIETELKRRGVKCIWVNGAYPTTENIPDIQSVTTVGVKGTKY